MTPAVLRRWWPIVLLPAGLVIWSLREPLASSTAYFLPGRAQVSSRGTSFEAFGDIAPTLIGRFGLVLALAALMALVGPYIAEWVPAALRGSSAAHVASGLVVFASGILYATLGDPHHAYRANARFHWVDYLTHDSGNFFYAAGRIPHLVFYDSPWLWNGVLGAGLAALAWVIARQLDFSPWLAAGLATLPLLSGNLLRFWDTAEDLKLNAVVLLSVMAGLLSRRPVVIGLLLAVAVLGRPTFLVLVPCVLLAEVTRSLSTAGWRRALHPSQQRFSLVVVTTATITTAGFQLLFSILGDRHFLVHGRFLRGTDSLTSVQPLEVDGFVISAFSGAYLGHLWALPILFFIGLMLATATVSLQPVAIRTTTLTILFFTVAHLFVHESQPLLYYNVRYLTYLLPLLAVASWIALRTLAIGRGPRVATAAISLAVLAPALIPATPFQERELMALRTEHEFLLVRSELRQARANGLVQYTIGQRGHRNYLAYVFRMGTPQLRHVTSPEQLRPGLLVAPRSDGWEVGTVVVQTQNYEVRRIASE